ncbi:PglA, partial [Pasteurella multocida subsp. multocida str. Anand1_cattle]
DSCLYQYLFYSLKNSAITTYYRHTKNQCDHFHIYLDGYVEIPDFIKNLGNKATVVHCKDKDNSIRDNGKFILLEELIEKNQD